MDVPTWYNNDAFCIDGAKFKGTDMQTVDGVLHLYGIGTYVWAWQNVEPNEEKIFNKIKEMLEL